jgi:SAM-dependent methyltransferase
MEPALMTAHLRCPITRDVLVPEGEARFLRSGSIVHPIREHAGRRFVDFLAGVTVDASVQFQRDVYEESGNRYSTQSEGDHSFVRHFVDFFMKSGAKNKDEVLFSHIQRLALSSSSRVLEIGCNDGRYLNVVCAVHGCRGVGIDVAEAAVRRAIQQRLPEVDAEFHVAEAAHLPFADASFDAIVSFDVFEHLGHEGVQSTLRECRRVLKPGGELLIYVISRNDRFTWHETIRRVSKGALGVDNQDGHSYENFLTPDEYRGYADEAGLRETNVQAYHGFWTHFVEEHLVLVGTLPKWCYKGLSFLDYALTQSERGNGFFASAVVS